MNSRRDPLLFLADTITNDSAYHDHDDYDDGSENENDNENDNLCTIILTQPPEVAADASDTTSSSSSFSATTTTTTTSTTTTMVETSATRDTTMGDRNDGTSAAAAAAANKRPPPVGAAAAAATAVVGRRSKLRKPNRNHRPSPKSVLETVPHFSEPSTAAGAGAGALKSKGSSSSSSSKEAIVNVNPPHLLSQIVLGRKVEVYWPDDDKYYPGVVASRRHNNNPDNVAGGGGGHVYTIHYDDGEVETVDLSIEKFRTVVRNENHDDNHDEDEEDATAHLARTRTTLEGLRRSHAEATAVANDDDRDASARRIAAVLHDDLGSSSDDDHRRRRGSRASSTGGGGGRRKITFRALLLTGIGKTVNKLAKSDDGIVSAAALPILREWRRIDEGTAVEVKMAAKAELAARITTTATTTTTAEAKEQEQEEAKEGLEGGGATGEIPTTPAVARPATATTPAVPTARADDAIDLTDSPPPPPPPPPAPPSKTTRGRRRSASKETTPARAPSSRRRKPSARAMSATTPGASAARITPGSSFGCADDDNDDGHDKENARIAVSSAPCPPELTSPSAFVGNAKRRLDNDGRAFVKPAERAADAVELSERAAADARPATSIAATPAPKSIETTARTTAEPRRSKPATGVGSGYAKPASATTGKDGKVAVKPTGDARPAASVAAAPADPKPPPTKKKKKKRSFDDRILYTMLTTCKPYTLKSLAKETDNTVEGLRHAMLSFLDKKLVLCKEFPGKKGSAREPKKLYWANPMSLAEAEAGGGAGAGRGKKGKGGGGGGVVARELSRLLSTTAEMDEARATLQRLERRHRALREELAPLLATPTTKELSDGIAAEERALEDVRGEIRAARDRVANASAGGGTTAGGRVARPTDRFKKRPPARPQDPVSLKRRINHMLGEYRARKRKCMDFVEELSDAMERKTKDVLGDKVLGLDTDETEWGQYEDGSTGKVYGKPLPKRGGLLGRRNNSLGQKGGDETAAMVKIPAKYKDV